MPDVTRRSFLEHTLLAASAGLAASVAQGARNENVAPEPTTRPAAGRAKPDRIGVAVIGLHGRGLEHIRGYTTRLMADEGVEVVAICDPDPRTFGPAQKVLDEAGRQPARTYSDIRKLLEDKSVHAVSIATPNHWHTLAGVWAMQAGKDAYVEKPVSHNVTEGRRLEQTRAKYNRICQAGTQSRSTRACQEAMRYIQQGHIGRVMLSRGLCYKRRKSIGHFADSTPPAGVDYNLWLGPAPVRPFNKNRFHYEWHWNWTYGNGDIGNQGVHQMDIARWALNKGLPNSVIALGGRYGYSDDGQTPNTMLALYDYGDSKLLFEVRGLVTTSLMGIETGNIVYGTEGFVAFTADYGTAVAFDNQGKKVRSFSGASSHFGNYIAAVRSRSQSDLTCPILEGHLSSALCHLGNISYRLGEPQPFPVRAKPLWEDMDLAEAFGRYEEHLANNTFDDSAPAGSLPTTRPAAMAGKKDEHKKSKSGSAAPDKPPLLKLQEMSYRLGPRLTFDPGTETFPDNAKANQLITREYREPFVVPAQV